MTKVRIYQIVDSCSEGVISTFVAPNQKYALREFKRFLTDPKIKDNVDPRDFELCASSEVEIAQSYSDSDNLEFIDDGDSVLGSVLNVSEVNDEA